MKAIHLTNIFLRSLSIQGSLNFWRMQNIGFAFAMLPAVRRLARDEEQTAGMLVRHTGMFNTHPYMTGPIIGSVVRMELSEDNPDAGREADAVKQALMGPYAGIGDSFFWGALRPFASVLAVLLAMAGYLLAPVVFLLLYNPLHFWVRLKGFIEGYRRGRSGIEFIRDLDLPRMGSRIRWLSVIVLAFVASLVAPSPVGTLVGYPMIAVQLAVLLMILIAYYVLRERVSAVAILYGLFLLSMAVSV